MAEMLDLATILKRSTADSLVIIDELGRGTSTHDGYGIAFASIERLAVEIKPIVLFCTHFHELTQMEGEIEGCFNLHVDAHIDGEDITMLYEVLPGACEASYGVHCAKLAKFPSEVVAQAHALVEQFDLQTQSKERGGCGGGREV